MANEHRPEWVNKLSSNRRAALSVAVVATVVLFLRVLWRWLT